MNGAVASPSHHVEPQRVVALDTETTGLSWRQGHRVVEVACVELVDGVKTGRTFHRYLNPERAIDPRAQAVHGLSAGFLRQQPVFADVVDEFMAFIAGAKLVIHNAPFDVGFLDNELRRCDQRALSQMASEVVDTVKLARLAFPGQKNSLDAVCERFGIDTSAREVHGALIDAALLADAYLALARHLDDSPLAQAANAPRYHLRPRRHASPDEGLSVRPMELLP